MNLENGTGVEGEGGILACYFTLDVMIFFYSEHQVLFTVGKL